jgi:diguanylate cyclase (GGDEF)-like protein
MRGAARITVVAGGVLVAAAWAVGFLGLLEDHRAVSDVLAEVVAVLVVVLAWRYRRDRTAIAAATVAMASLVARLFLDDPMHVAERSYLTIAVASVLAILSLLRDRPVGRPLSVFWAALVVALGWTAAVGLAWFTGEDLIPVLGNQLAPKLALFVSALVIVGSFAVRRGAFEGGLAWVLVACAAAFGGWGGPHQATLYFAAAELVLLVGLMEDSYRLAYHDELTGLPGRRAFGEAMLGLRDSFTIAMVDVDRFKRFNDRHGHDAGDQALRMVADEIGSVTGGGRAFRYGGEEFAILFGGKTVAEVRDDLENLRGAIERRKFALRAPDRPRTKPEKPAGKTRPPRRVTVTASIGFADTNPRRPTAAAVLRAADRALYRAKKAGRNRVVAAGDRL